MGMHLRVFPLDMGMHSLPFQPGSGPHPDGICDAGQQPGDRRGWHINAIGGYCLSMLLLVLAEIVRTPSPLGNLTCTPTRPGFDSALDAGTGL